MRNPEEGPTLFIFAGLPGSGKSTLAKHLAVVVPALYLRIDTVEQGLRDVCGIKVEGEGYRLSYRLAADNLRLGLNVVADSCNPIELTRSEWQRIAIDSQASYVDIEVVCSDAQQHRARVESRQAEVAGLRLPTWRDVAQREYHTWTGERLIIDTAGRTVAQSRAELLERLGVTRG